jgi:hypothetical protein
MTDEVANLVVEQLKLLRGDVQQTNARLDEANRRLDDGFGRLDERVGRLEERVERVEARLDHLAEGQIRMATAVTAAIDRLGDRIDNVLVGAMGRTVRDHEERILKLEKSVYEE